MKVLIMAGGSGERFWPLSTKEHPKQLLKLVSEKSMIRETVDRILGLVTINDVFIATNSIQVPGVIKELPELPVENIIIEPAFRDTAAAIAYGSTYISKYEENPTIVVLASDHLIKDEEEFIKMIQIADDEAKKGAIVTLGIKPHRPETGYGYISLNSLELGVPVQTNNFLEKPNYETALKYVKAGNYVWNSGMFVFKYNVIMSELNMYLPNHVKTIRKLKTFISELEGEKLSEKVKPFFNEFDRISIDFGVMEKSKIIKCIPVDFGWNDVGGFNSLEDVFDRDEFGSISKDCKYFFVDSSNNIVISDNKDKLITTIGVHNKIIIDSKNGILVCDRSDAQKIKQLLKKI